MKIKVHDIEYDTDGRDVDLPTEMILDGINEDDLSEEGSSNIAEKISAFTGECVLTFHYTVIHN
jgi:hypothetical protein